MTSLPPVAVDALIFMSAAAFLVIGFLVLKGNSRGHMRKRVAGLQKRKATTPKSVQEVMTLRRKTAEGSAFIKVLTKPLPDVKRLEALLERAGSKLNAKTFLLRCGVCFIAIALFVSVALGKQLLLGLFLGLILSFWLPIKFLKGRIAKRLKRFLRLFPNGIDLIVRGLRSGLPVSESINLVGKEVEAPVGPIFINIADTMKLGVPLEKALQETAKKLDCTEFNFFATSVILQRETGGNLAEILDNLSSVLRQRFMMHMKVKALSSEARASSVIVGALPFLVMAALLVVSPGYLNPLVNDYRGNIAAGVAAGMLCFGVWVMNHMAKFEI